MNGEMVREIVREEMARAKAATSQSPLFGRTQDLFHDFCAMVRLAYVISLQQCLLT